MKKYIVAGNWKMNMTLSQGKEFTKELLASLDGKSIEQTSIILGVPFIHLSALSEMCSGTSVQVVAQNCAEHASGAYTGEVSTAMIKSTGAQGVIVGHSERRVLYSESDDAVNTKLKLTLKEGLLPILCVGESLEQRQKNRQESIVAEQLTGALFGLEADEVSKLVIAYEPVWAIGTGETASPEQAEEMHAFIRDYLKEYYGDNLASKMAILYGGSVKPENAKDIFSQANVNGGLIGGASLKVESFKSLIETAEKQ